MARQAAWVEMVEATGVAAKEVETKEGMGAMVAEREVEKVAGVMVVVAMAVVARVAVAMAVAMGAAVTVEELTVVGGLAVQRGGSMVGTQVAARAGETEVDRVENLEVLTVAAKATEAVQQVGSVEAI